MRPFQQRLAPSASRHLHTRQPLPRPHRCFHRTTLLAAPRKRPFFTSNVYLSPVSDNDGEPQSQGSRRSAPEAAEDKAKTPLSKRKPARTAGVKNSLRRVAVIAQQPTHRDGQGQLGRQGDAAESTTLISAVSLAESFNMPAVIDILRAHGFDINPDNTGFDSTEVAHARGANGGDIFVFPSGTIVTWSLPLDIVTKQLLRAAEEPHDESMRETEDLEYTEDATRDTSGMKGDMVVIGTKHEARSGDRLDTTLAKVAFSSGLARSTKLAVLESSLTNYFESTRNIPTVLSMGSRFPLGRRFILQKTGELLSLRARLNHYSELTDSLPDMLWDSRAELGLEGYYEQVGRALDVNVRIRTLNQKMDYAQEIASVLREMSSEQHGTRLEWIIIVLIFVEVIFEVRRIVLEWRQEHEEQNGVATQKS